MPDVLERLEALVARLAFPPRLNASLRKELEAIARDALADENEHDVVPTVVSLIHLLVECLQGTIEEPLARQALSDLQKSLRDGPSRACTLGGTEISLEDVAHDERGSSLLNWKTFCRRYASSYGKSVESEEDLKELWRQVENEELAVPQKDLHLSGANGVVWFTRENALRGACSLPAGGRIDGDRAYDQLGLEWAEKWEIKGREGETSSSRALLISARLNRRSRAERGLRTPTTLDGWQFLAFVPRRPGGAPAAWPSFTVDPRTGQAALPEGIHGPVTLPEGESCPIESCGTVTKPTPDRVRECGTAVVARALARLDEIHPPGGSE